MTWTHVNHRSGEVRQPKTDVLITEPVTLCHSITITSSAAPQHTQLATAFFIRGVLCGAVLLRIITLQCTLMDEGKKTTNKQFLNYTETVPQITPCSCTIARIFAQVLQLVLLIYLKCGLVLGLDLAFGWLMVMHPYL